MPCGTINQVQPMNLDVGAVRRRDQCAARPALETVEIAGNGGFQQNLVVLDRNDIDVETDLS